MCLKWVITGYTTGRLWLITSGRLSIYVIIYIDHVVDIDFSEIWLHSGALHMCSREGDRVGSGLIRRMDASPPSHGRRLGQGATPKCPFPPCLTGASPSVPPAQFDSVFCVLCAISSVFPRRLLFVLHLMDRRLEPLPPPSSPPPRSPPPLYRLAHGGGGHAHF